MNIHFVLSQNTADQHSLLLPVSYLHTLCAQILCCMYWSCSTNSIWSKACSTSHRQYWKSVL